MEKGLIFTYVLTYGGAAASLFNPFIGLLVYICFAIVKPESMWFWSVPIGNYSRIVAIALLLGWAAKGFGNWQFGRARGIVLALIAFWIWMGVSALQARDHRVALEFIESQSKVFLPFLVGITTIDSMRKLKQLAWVIVLTQGYVGLEMNQAYYSGFNRVQEIGFGEMDNNSVAIAMVTGAGLAFFLGLTAPAWWQKLLALAFGLLMVHTVMFSFSRGGLLGLIVVAVTSFLLIPKQPKHYVIFILVVLLGVRLAGKEVRARFGSSFGDEKGQRDETAQERLNLWRDCWASMLKRPIFGLGPRHWPLIAMEYGYSPNKEAHSLWLQIGAELGFPGLIFLLLFYGQCLIKLWPFTLRRRSVADPWLRDAARMSIAALVGFMVSSQFVSLYGLELPYYVVLIAAGALKLSSFAENASAAESAHEALNVNGAAG